KPSLFRSRHLPEFGEAHHLSTGSPPTSETRQSRGAVGRGPPDRRGGDLTMISVPGKVTNLVKNSWARWMPRFSVRGSIEDSQHLVDLVRVVQTGVLDPDVLAKHLRATSLYGSNGAVVKEVQVRRVLKYHTGRRCTLEISLRAEDGWHLLIAKIYRKDRSDLFDVMKG